VKFGVFDHIDANGMAIETQYAQRLALVERYEALGYHCYHLAEHHATRLGMAPSPGLFLSAVAQRTTTLRFGPLVYLLPLYHPVRLLEEIGMLDRLSGGRLQLGIGKGGQVAEHSRFGVSGEDLDALFAESFEILMKGLAGDVLEHEGRFFNIPPTPQLMKPLQRPQPPLWYGVGNPARCAWAAERGINLVAGLPNAGARPIADAFAEELEKRSVAGPDGPFMGLMRQVYVAPTDAEAERIASRAWRTFAANFNWLVNWLGRPAFPIAAEFADAQAFGVAFAGSPASVRDWIAATRDETGINYLAAELVFGDLNPEEALQCVELFGREVMPAFSD
jgi:alkanesulfonate monooxygenase SsuD/methylene tetrahydromethanopterin reductase-like flavin-dependent oxidoreductase (luciferase family)